MFPETANAKVGFCKALRYKETDTIQKCLRVKILGGEGTHQMTKRKMRQPKKSGGLVRRKLAPATEVASLRLTSLCLFMIFFKLHLNFKIFIGTKVYHFESVLLSCLQRSKLEEAKEIQSLRKRQTGVR